MDTPLLAGKIAALSLGALPVFYALHHVAALSQCVQGGWGTAGRDWGVRWGPERRCVRTVGPAPAELGAPATSAWQDSNIGMAERGWVRTRQPEVLNPPARRLCAGGGGAPGKFEAWGEGSLRSRTSQRAEFWSVSGVFPGIFPTQAPKYRPR